MKKKGLILFHAAELLTCSGFCAKKGAAMSDVGLIPDGALVIEGGIIRAVGDTAEILAAYKSPEYEMLDCSGKVVVPGFVDSHTHFVFGGYRADEFAWRMSGVSYMDIMLRGGGINATLIPTRAASKEALMESGLRRLASMLSFGVTTVEGKSGYGMDLDTEIRQLEVMEALNHMQPVDIVPTFMGAHATPPEYKGDTDGYVDFIIQSVLPVVAEKKLAVFCDVFCEKNVFSTLQSRKLLLAAKQYGFALKLHADEIVQLGGAELAAKLCATSADHLLQVSDEGIQALARGDTIATLLPATAFSLKEPYARARDMIDAGCAVAVASDLNPGSCYTESIPLLFALGNIYMGMSAEELVTALTLNGAAALGLSKTVGSLDPGKKGDALVLDCPSFKHLTYHFAVNSVETVIKEGRIVFERPY